MKPASLNVVEIPDNIINLAMFMYVFYLKDFMLSLLAVKVYRLVRGDRYERENN